MSEIKNTLTRMRKANSSKPASKLNYSYRKMGSSIKDSYSYKKSNTGVARKSY